MSHYTLPPEKLLGANMATLMFPRANIYTGTLLSLRAAAPLQSVNMLLEVSSLPRESTNWFISNTTQNKLDKKSNSPSRVRVN